MNSAQMPHSEDDVSWWKSQSGIPGSGVSKEEAEASEKLYRDAIRLSDEIREAFKGVTLGGGIDYRDAPTEEGAAKRNPAERDSWEAVYSDPLRIAELGGFWQLDRASLKFHLPAFMIADLQGKLEISLPYKLYTLSQQREDLAGTLDSRQRDTVIAYLRLCLRWDIYDNEQSEIRDSLENFWDRKDRSPIGDEQPNG